MYRVIRKQLAAILGNYCKKLTVKENFAHTTKWDTIVCNTLDWLGKDFSLLAIDKYGNNMSEIQLCFKYFISKTTLYNKINFVCEIMLALAIDNKLIRIDLINKEMKINMPAEMMTK